jgi:hypothetical protein
MDVVTVLMLAAILMLGVYKGIPLLTVIGAFLLVAYFYGARTQKAAPSGGVKRPKVRPIIVRRRYAGPESIYPSDMKMYVENNWNTMAWWEKALGAAGYMAGFGLQGGQTMAERKR